MDVVPIPPKSPNCNPHAERFVRSVKEECLDRMILFGRNALERALREYRLHYLRERNHQGLGNTLLEPISQDEGGLRVECRERLGGLLRYYYRAAARERRSDDGVEHLAWSLPAGIVGGKLEAQARSDAARVDPDLA